MYIRVYVYVYIYTRIYIHICICIYINIFPHYLSSSSWLHPPLSLGLHIYELCNYFHICDRVGGLESLYNTVTFSRGRKNLCILFSAKILKQGDKSHYISSAV